MSEGAYLMEKIRSRCVEEGECLIWPGAVNSRGPVATIRQKQFSLRKVAWEDAHGKAFPPDRVASPGCKDPLCLAHVVAKTWKQLNSRTPTVAHRAKISMSKRRGSKLDEAAVAEIRFSSEPMSILIGRHGISKAYGYMIKRGDNRRDYSSPFAGLLHGAGA